MARNAPGRSPGSRLQPKLLCGHLRQSRRARTPMGPLRQIRRLGTREPDPCVADGAEWIRLQSREVFSDQEHFLCDFYHVSQYLADASKICRAQSPSVAQDPAKAAQKRLHKVIQELAQHISPPHSRGRGSRLLCSPLHEQPRDAFDYPRALKHQLPIVRPH